MATKVDFKRELPMLYRASRKPSLIEVPELQFAIVEGQGDPNHSQDFGDAIGALYGVSYTLKFMIKKADPALDFTVMPLEAQWWDERGFDFERGDRSTWHWIAMIFQPEAVTEDLFAEALEKAAERKPLPAAAKVRLERFEEGLCAQVLHVGPYSAERPTIEALHAFIADEGCEPRGHHHEIYLGDPRRTAPDKLKTILRQPCQRS